MQIGQPEKQVKGLGAKFRDFLSNHKGTMKAAGAVLGMTAVAVGIVAATGLTGGLALALIGAGAGAGMVIGKIIHGTDKAVQQIAAKKAAAEEAQFQEELWNSGVSRPTEDLDGGVVEEYPPSPAFEFEPIGGTQGVRPESAVDDEPRAAIDHLEAAFA